jgi:hypothetical protein
MKKFLSIMLVLSMVIPVNAHAWSIFDSEWFEPTLFCLGAGAAGYTSAKKGDEVNQGALFCAGGALIGWLINSRYKSKYGAVYQEEIKDLRRDIQEMQIMQAQKAAKVEEDTTGSVKIQEYVPGKRLEDGSVLYPTLRDRLVIPGEGSGVGE